MTTARTLSCLVFLGMLAGCGQEPEITARGIRKSAIHTDDLGPAIQGGKVDVLAAPREQAPAPQQPGPVLPGKPPAPSPGPGHVVSRASPDAGPQAVGPYAVIEVKEAGTIRGTCKISKAATVPTIAVSKEVPQCGHGDSHPSERMVYDPATLGLKNCIVFLSDISQGKDWSGDMAKDDRSATLDQKHCKYVPHVMVVRAETQLAVLNSDPTKHNIHGFQNTELVTKFNFGTAEGASAPEVPEAFLDEPANYIVKCDIHPWMNAYIRAVKHPYHAVTDEKGAYVLDRVPPGTYKVVCWHEGMTSTPTTKDGAINGYVYGPDVVSPPKDVTVEANKEAVVDFEVPAP
jgi:plastocyanin